MRLLVWAAAVSCCLCGPANAQAGTPTAIAVGTVEAERRPVNKAADFVGRIEAIDRVTVRARVTGNLETVLFRAGDLVKAGDPLFRIEAGPLDAAVQQAKGALLRAQARYANATLQRQRAEELAKSSSGTRSALDERVADEKSAQGDVVSADADLKTATINRGYAQIAAPITGRIGRANVTAGNLVGPDSGALALIVSQDPIYVTFPVSQREFLHIERQERMAPTAALLVRLAFADGTAYPQSGKIDFIDGVVDKETDTVLVRAVMPNTDDTLRDGQLVRVAVQGEQPSVKVVIPQAALIIDQAGSYVFVADQGRAVVKRIKTGAEVGPDVVVENGLGGGEQVIVEGGQSLRPGAAIQASAVAPPAGRS